MRRFLPFLLLLPGCADAFSERPTAEAIIEISTHGHLTAAFGETRPVKLEQAGACSLRAQPSMVVNRGRLPDAGLLRISSQGVTVEAMPDDHGDYHRRLAPLPLRGPEQMVAIDAAGGRRVPAFHVEVTTPHPMTLELDNALEPEDHTLSVLHDLAFRWVGAEDSTVGVLIEGGRKHIECRFPGAAGAGVVPQSLLAELPLGAGRRVVWSGRETRTTLGGLPATVAAIAVAVEGEITLEAR